MRVWKINADSGRVGYRLADPGEMEQWPARLVEISPAEWDVVGDG